MTLELQVQWYSADYIDITDTVQAWNVAHGASVNGNPDRPTIQSASGTLITRAQLEPFQRSGRFAFRAIWHIERALDDFALLWSGWIQEPRLRGSHTPEIEWKLSGRLATDLEVQHDLNQPEQTIVATLNDRDLWQRILPSASTVDRRSIPDRTLKPLNLTASAGAIVSRLAAVSGAVVAEGKSGVLKIAAANLAVPPASGAVLSSETTRVMIPTSRERADRIRNRAITRTPERLGTTTPIRFRATASTSGTGARPSSVTATATVTVPEDTAHATYTGWTARVVRAEMLTFPRSIRRWGQYPGPYTWGAYASNAVWAPATPTPSASVSVSGATATITVTWATGPTQTDLEIGYVDELGPGVFGGGILRHRTPGDESGTWWAATTDTDYLLERTATEGSWDDLTGIPVELPIFGLRAFIELDATRNQVLAEEIHEVVNADSITEWGDRPLVLPDWLVGNTDLQREINSLSRLRHEHTVTLPFDRIGQWDSDVAEYVELDLLDTVRNVDIAEICVLTNRRWSWTPNRGLYLQLVCLETGVRYDRHSDQVPGPVQSLTAVALSTTSIAASWLEPDTGGVPESYTVTIRVAGTTTNVGKVVITTLSHTFTGLDPDTEYQITVAPRNSVGLGPDRMFTISTPAAPLAVPGPVRNLTARLVRDGFVTISWSAPNTGGAAVDYRLRETLVDGSVPWTQAITVSGTSWTNSRPFAPNNVRFGVHARNAAGPGPERTVDIVIPNPIPPPSGGNPVYLGVTNNRVYMSNSSNPVWLGSAPS